MFIGTRNETCATELAESKEGDTLRNKHSEGVLGIKLELRKEASKRYDYVGEPSTKVETNRA